MRLLLVFALSLLSASSFAEPTTFYCEYDRVASPEGVEDVDNFILTFVVDDEAGKYYMVGNNGTSKVSPIFTGEHVTFVEITAMKNVMTTTITNNGNSVHSRNTVLFGDLVATQYYGTCETR